MAKVLFPEVVAATRQQLLVNLDFPQKTGDVIFSFTNPNRPKSHDPTIKAACPSILSPAIYQTFPSGRQKMLARNVLRAASLVHPHQARRLPQTLPFMMRQARNYAAAITIKVPQMAESISEGTLKQFTKQVGDYVEQDEEIATIETDKVRINSRSPSDQLPGR